MMVDGWIKCRLADACQSIDYGYTASAQEKPIGPKFLRITDIVAGYIDWASVPYTEADKTTREKYRLFDRDLVLARTGASTGASQYIKDPPEAMFASYLVRLKIDAKFDSRFISYYLKSEQFWSHMRGVLGDKSAQPNASAATMTQAPMNAPADVSEQRSIAHILGTLDDKIELNRCMNETLEAIARSIYKSWFVDFDPVRAKASGEPYESICRRLRLTPDLLALFPDRLHDSELGEIPDGWVVRPVGEVVQVVGGSTPSTKMPEYWEGGIFDWATPKDLSGLTTSFLLTTERKITELGLKQISSGLLAAGTLLMSSRAPIGYLAIAEVPVAVNQGFIAILCEDPLSPYYMLNWCHFNMDAIKQRAGGTTFAEISKSGFRPIPFIMPRNTVLHAFSDIVKPLYSLIAQRCRESASLGDIRDTLLPKLISGAIRMP